MGYPHQNRKLARWIGVAHRVGQTMCFWLLPQSGIPIERTTIQEIPIEENTEIFRQELQTFDKILNRKLQSYSDDGINVLNSFRLYRADEDDDSILEEVISPEAQVREVDEIEPDAYDEFLLTEPLLIHDGQTTRGTVIGRKRDMDGNLIGTYNNNPLLNSRIYMVEFPDGDIAEFSANKIAEAIYNNLNDDGEEELLFKGIVTHEVDHEIALLNKQKLFTTHGWRICVEWNDGSTTWHPLADVKNSFMVELANYALQYGLENEPAFKWWIRPTIKHKELFICATKARYASRTHKFGIHVPRTVQEALDIDRNTKTTFWQDAIK